MINVTIWNEFRHEKQNEKVKAIYPDGIHAYIKGFLSKEEDMNVVICALDDPAQGLTEELLDSTELSIADVADALGYENPSYFCRVFKRDVGVAPTLYRSISSIEK